MTFPNLTFDLQSASRESRVLASITRVSHRLYCATYDRQTDRQTDEPIFLCVSDELASIAHTCDALE